jgi:hypothetical protein
MLEPWTSLSAALYLVPIAVFVGARLERGRPWGLVALDVPMAVAVDLLSILLLARFVTLETAALVSRALWLVAAPYVAFRRRAHLAAWFREAGVRSFVLPVAGLATAWVISRTMSIPYAVWDRHWHIPLVTSMRGQHTPFFNVYENGGKLYYHYAGNALAAILQTLSFDRIHASNALSRAHDLMFALTGAFFGLVLPSFRRRGLSAVLMTVAATLLSGPATMFRSGSGRPDSGQSITNLLTLSFRPHVSLSYLLMLGFVAAVLLPVVTEDIAPRSTRPALLATTGLLVLTDETSLGLLGLMAGAMWLLHPAALGKTRLAGLAVLGSLVGVIGAVVLALGGTFSLGAHRQSVSWVSWQAPGFYQPSVPLGSSYGRILLLVDMLSVFGALVLGLVAWIGSRRRNIGVTFAAYATVALVSLVCLTRLVVNGESLECHRFATAALLLAPLSTIEWLAGPAAPQLEGHRGFWGPDNYYSTDCRASTAAKLGEIARPTYVTRDLWYLYSGCHPIFSPGPDQSQDKHDLVIGGPDLGLKGLSKIDVWVGHDDPLPVLCAAAPDADPICTAQQKSGACRPLTSTFEECTLSPSARRALLDPAAGTAIN